MSRPAKPSPDVNLNDVLDPKKALVPQTVRVNEERVRRGFLPKIRKVAAQAPFAADALSVWWAARDPETPVAAKGIPFMKLADFNQLQAPYEIHVGQILNLNAKATSSTANSKANDSTNAPDDAEVVTSAIVRPDINSAAEPATTATASNAQTPADTGKTVTATDLEAITDADIQWQWPLAGKVSTGFDAQTNKGLNITGNAGQVINAAGAGKVIYSGMDVRGYGKLIIIKHNSNLLSVYAHQGNSLVKEGVFVASGEKLANLPAQANNKSPVLHFEIRQKGKPVDPASYLPNNPATIGSNS